MDMLPDLYTLTYHGEWAQQGTFARIAREARYVDLGTQGGSPDGRDRRGAERHRRLRLR